MTGDDGDFICESCGAIVVGDPHYLPREQIAYCADCSKGEAAMRAAVRQLDPEGGWDHETTGGWPDMPTYRALRQAEEMGYVEKDVAFDIMHWRLTGEGIQFRKELENHG